MAILNVNAGQPTSGSINGTRINLGSTTSVTMTTSSNNRRATANSKRGTGVVPTPIFSPMDNLVTSLDAQFDLLPNQTAWNLYALSIAGQWDLCANCQPDTGGKKLFRQINYNRTLLGQPLITVPPGTAPAPACAGLVVNMAWNNINNWWFLTGGSLPADDGVQVTARVGQGLGNPSYVLNSANNNQGHTVTPLVTWCAAILTALGYVIGDGQHGSINVPLCCSSITGIPSVASNMLLAFDDS